MNFDVATVALHATSAPCLRRPNGFGVRYAWRPAVEGEKNGTTVMHRKPLSPSLRNGQKQRLRGLGEGSNAECMIVTVRHRIEGRAAWIPLQVAAALIARMWHDRPTSGPRTVISVQTHDPRLLVDGRDLGVAACNTSPMTSSAPIQ